MSQVVIGDASTNVVLRPGDGSHPVEAVFHSATMEAQFRGGYLISDPTKDLEKLRLTPSSVAHINTDDGFIMLTLTHDTLGGVEVDAEGRCYGPTETYARLKFSIDQSFLPDVVREMKKFAQGRVQ